MTRTIYYSKDMKFSRFIKMQSQHITWERSLFQVIDAYVYGKDFKFWKENLLPIRDWIR